VTIVGVATGVGLLWVLVVLAPHWFVKGSGVEGAARLKAENDVRTTLVQVAAGGVLAVGGYFTYRQLRTTREGQITDRYTRAVDQLGHNGVDVRLGGVFALERIARDSPVDRRTIGEILTAVVRSRVTRGEVAPPPGEPERNEFFGRHRLLQERAPDVQACVTVLGRGRFSSSPAPLDLRRTDLRLAILSDAYLEGVVLAGAQLDRSTLRRAHLEGANLAWADLVEVHAEGIHLEAASLPFADLTAAILEGARLAGADLGRAILDGTNLAGADLDGANLQGAQSTERTVWPTGFDWQAAGVVLAETPCRGPHPGR
jgi:hypothetical protein